MFYEQFLLFCDANSVSRTKACVDCGISRTAWHKWEDGAVPNGATLNKLAGYFGVSVNELLGDQAQKENPATVSDEVDPVTMELFSMVNEATQDERQVMLEMLRLLRKQRKENV